MPEPLTTSLTANGDVVVGYGQLRIPHRTGRHFVEMQQVAWVHEVKGDRVARITTFKSWTRRAQRRGSRRAPRRPGASATGSWRSASAARPRPLLELVTA